MGLIEVIHSSMLMRLLLMYNYNPAEHNTAIPWELVRRRSLSALAKYE